MIAIRPAGALALALLLAACGEKQDTAPENRAAATASPESTAQDRIYSGSGTVRSIAGDQVAIAHGPIEGIGWPAMTMTFAATPGIAAGVKVGDQVAFSFRQNGSAYVLTSAKPR